MSTESHAKAGRQPFVEHFNVSAFRGVRSVSLESLGRINLLIGRNDSGKTSILEALAVFASPLDMVEWAAIARFREVRTNLLPGEALSAIDSIRWLFPHNPNARPDDDEEHGPIQLSADGRITCRSLDAQCQRMRGIPPEIDRDRPSSTARGRQTEAEPAEDEGWLVKVMSTSVDDLFGPAPPVVEFPMWSSLGFRSVPRPRSKAPRVAFLAPYAHRNQAMNLRLLTSAIVEDWKGKIDQLLNRLDPDIEQVEIITTRGGTRPAIAVRHRRAGLVPVSVLGDGLRRALSIALCIAEARNGLVLIDELEAALHVTALDRIFPWIVDACHANNVQIVATTHSLEAIDAIAKLTASGSVRDVNAYHLTQGPGMGPPKRYSGGMLRRLVHEQGLDVR